MKTLTLLLIAQSDPWLDSYAQAAGFLVKGQDRDGLWSRELHDRRWPSMALTVLAIDALVRMPADLRARHREAIDRGIEAVLKAQDEKEGGWGEPPGQLKAYVTSIALAALQAHDPEAHKERIARARKFLVRLQHVDGSTGYNEIHYELVDGKLEPRAAKSGNLSTTGGPAEALAESGYKDRAYWDKVIKFVSQCQNMEENELDPEWARLLELKGYKIGKDGGFFYHRDVDNPEHYGGFSTDADEKKMLNSYGSMTYLGLKTYLYAGLSKEDLRVRAAVQWMRHNYTLERHPGFPFEADTPAARRKDRQGLYYYYLMMARALDAWGERPFVTSDGKAHDWPREIAAKLIDLQEDDGSWFNDQRRWWEDDRVLVTAYCMKIYAVLSKSR